MADLEARIRDLEERLEAVLARALMAEARVVELERARAATARTYLSKHGELFVCDGISNGRWWSTYYRNPRTGSLKRLRSLPLRQTPEEAQRDLDEYARRHRLPVYPGE